MLIQALHSPAAQLPTEASKTASCGLRRGRFQGQSLAPSSVPGDCTGAPAGPGQGAVSGGCCLPYESVRKGLLIPFTDRKGVQGNPVKNDTVTAEVQALFCLSFLFFFLLFLFLNFV